MQRWTPQFRSASLRMLRTAHLGYLRLKPMAPVFVPATIAASIHHRTHSSFNSMPLNYFLEIIGTPMDYKFAMTVLLVIAFVALIIIAAKLVTRRANRIERERLAAEKQQVIDSARNMLRPPHTPNTDELRMYPPPYKGERKARMSPHFAAPYGAHRANLQTVPKGHEDAASRMFRRPDDRVRRMEASAPARNDADDVLLATGLLYAATSTSTGRTPSSRDSGYGDDLGAEAMPSGTDLNDIRRTGTYRVDIPETNYPTESARRAEPEPESTTRYRSEPSYDSSPSFSSSDSFSSSSSYDSGSSSSSYD